MPRRVAAQRDSSSRSNRGFTLLEAIVALTIFAAGGMAVYGLFNTNLMALGRAQDVASQMPAEHRAIEYLGSINPHERLDGQVDLGDYDLTWSSRLLEPMREGRALGGSLGVYDLGLYEVTFVVSRDGGPAATHRLRLVGYEKVRKLFLE